MKPMVYMSKFPIEGLAPHEEIQYQIKINAIHKNNSLLILIDGLQSSLLLLQGFLH